MSALVISKSYETSRKWIDVFNISDKDSIAPFAPFFVVPKSSSNASLSVVSHGEAVFHASPAYSHDGGILYINGPTTIFPKSPGRGSNDWPLLARVKSTTTLKALIDQPLNPLSPGIGLPIFALGYSAGGPSMLTLYGIEDDTVAEAVCWVGSDDRPIGYIYGKVQADVAPGATGTLATVIGNLQYINVCTQQTFAGETVPVHRSYLNHRWEFLDRCERLFQYQLLTNWFGGLAIALRRSADGVTSGKKVIVRDPFGMYAYQRAGDRGFMKYTVENKFYAGESPCGSEPIPPTDPLGKCETSGDCIESTYADCEAIYGTWTKGGTC